MVPAGVTTRDLNELIADPNPDFSTLTDFEKRIWKATHRPPEEIDAMAARVRAMSKPSRPLPPGKNWMQVADELFGDLPPDPNPMSEEEFLQAVRDI